MSIEGTFVSHLVELRARIIRIISGLMIGFLPCAFYARELYTLLAQPLLEKLPQGGQMIATDVATPFFVPMKVAMMVAFLITLPHTLYQVWAFVAPGLYSHEKRLALPLVVASSLLFFFGMAFAYLAALPLVFEFITYFAPEGVAVMTDIDKYLNFVLSMFLAFGITFEVPVFVVVLARTGIITIKKLKEIRHYVLVGAFVIGAIFTPPDVISQFMLAVPLYLLYELGIFITVFLMKEHKKTTQSNQVAQSQENQHRKPEKTDPKEEKSMDS
ncbi:Sec-independent protein translocase TatC [Nitrosomonas cryotolerans]|uniref:Sec-independent protein translocase protein TatC n=1 Tax=Nitrosomonas cryotolerans ATCC 49181 TaxID=1131553 RepID=A0A1N6JG36_9PROT|nr:twin-arginine translocase subunit TatC [Nitrosomonas cryotolerans]SFP67400.1 Sec-independent protein translocase TatC [Nitrosomonas cryotolerans]SIO43368.1 Sec-independent protein translocase TatC [Nitrosomonas cryotolerans ATCC 49181]